MSRKKREIIEEKIVEKELKTEVKADIKPEIEVKQKVKKEEVIPTLSAAPLKKDFYSVVKESSSLIKQIYMWGSNQYGQLGNGKKGPSLWQATPQFVDALKSRNLPSSLSVGKDIVASVTIENQLFIWGNGEKGEMGVGERVLQSARPYLCVSLRSLKINQVSCGVSHVLALQSNGLVFSWGMCCEFSLFFFSLFLNCE